MQKSKLKLFFVCFVIATVVIIIKLIDLSLIEKNSELQKNNKNTFRGTIYDRKMNALTVNIPTYTVYLDKEVLVRNKKKITNDVFVLYNHVANALDISMAEMEKKLSENKRTVTIAKNIDANLYKKIEDIKKENNALQSLYGVATSKRFYPYSDIFAHNVGYMDKSYSKGYIGLEATYEHLLSAENDDPKNIVLSLDKDIQIIVRNELLKFVSEKPLNSTTVIVADVRDGAILANYSYPSFDPNNPFIYTNGERIDRSTMNTIYPGSAMKIFAELATLEAGVASLDDTFICKGYYDYSPQTRITCERAHGKIKFDEILKYSCNVGAITLAERLDNKYYYDYLLRFGFGKPTGLGEENKESAGIFHPVNKWHKYSKGYLTIGYDLSVSPIQLLQSYIPLLNGGYMPSIHQVRRVFNSTENIDLNNQYKKTKVIEPQYSQVARLLLRKGVEAGATGSQANLINIDVVGKTGTAITKAYTEGSRSAIKYYQSVFIGGFPLEDPKVVMLVLIDGPEGSAQSGGRIASPLFAKIAMQILPYLDISEQLTYTVDINNIESLIPIPEKREKDIMPNLKGKSLRDALTSLSAIVDYHNAKISIQGEGYVVEQKPQSDSEILDNQIIQLLLSPVEYR